MLSEDLLSEDWPSDDVASFLALARGYLADLYIRLATAHLTPAQQTELWRLVNGVEAAMRMRAVVLGLELDAIERELEGIDREIERRLRRDRPRP